MNETTMNRPIRVACIGNMNNNYFSLMRYLRGLGLDAYLLMYQNEHDIFLPGNDTWELEKWGPYIKTLDFYNYIYPWARVKPAHIREVFAGYDIYIGCGLTPAYFARAKMKLDIFTPYAYGIEFIDNSRFTLTHPRDSLYKLYARIYQEKGIKDASAVITMQQHFFRDYNNVFKRLKIRTIPSTVPMIYNLEETGDSTRQDTDIELKEYTDRFREKDFIVFSHSRQLWKELPGYYKGALPGKKNDVLIRGFARYLESAVSRYPLLVLLEYGPDVRNSKELIASLGIAPYVMWLPRMPRKKLMELLEYADVGADQFGNGFLGGTGREILSMGKPLINYIDTSDEEYKRITGHEMPFVLRAQTPEEVSDRLLEFETNRTAYVEAGKKNKDWFDRYFGIGLAEMYKRIVEELYDKKTREC
jgi:hypothetical protein